MTPSAWPRTVIAWRRFGVISWDTSAAEISAAISRSSMTLIVTVLPWLAARAAARCAARSASSLVEEGSLVPALTTASRNGSVCSELFMDHVLVFVVAGVLVALGQVRGSGLAG